MADFTYSHTVRLEQLVWKFQDMLERQQFCISQLKTNPPNLKFSHDLYIAAVVSQWITERQMLRKFIGKMSRTIFSILPNYYSNHPSSPYTRNTREATGFIDQIKFKKLQYDWQGYNKPFSYIDFQRKNNNIQVVTVPSRIGATQSEKWSQVLH